MTLGRATGLMDSSDQDRYGEVTQGSLLRVEELNGVCIFVPALPLEAEAQRQS